MIGLILSIFIGLLLGLLGAGGSILTVPLFVYAVGMAPGMASYASLFVVGSTAFIGAIGYAKEKRVRPGIAVQFFIGSFLGVTLARRWLLPWIPNTLFQSAFYVVTKDHLIMFSFSLLMIFAARSMIKVQQNSEIVGRNRIGKNSFLQLFVKAFFVGITTGFVGAGGGFLIVPALVLFAGLTMKETVGTSLLIIGMNSMGGFLISWFGNDQQARPDLIYLLQFTVIATIGLWLGKRISRNIPEQNLKKIFGFFVLILGLVIFVQQVGSLFSH